MTLPWPVLYAVAKKDDPARVRDFEIYRDAAAYQVQLQNSRGHGFDEGGKRRLMVASLRYLDTLVKRDGAWLFAERLLYVDWVDERALS